MTSLVSKFIKTTVGSKNQDTDYKPVINSSGDFTKTIGLETILNSLNTILQIPTRTYLFDPPFGCDIFKRVFDPTDQITLDLLKDEIENQLFGNDDRARVDSIDIKFLRNKKTFFSYCSMKRRRNPRNETTCISINDSSIHRNHHHLPTNHG
jgi:phage baseplate assembly protein W